MTRSLLPWVFAAASCAAALAACFDSSGTLETGSGGASTSSSSVSGSAQTSGVSSTSDATSTGSGTNFTGQSCQEIHTAHSQAPSGVYTLTGGAMSGTTMGSYQAYCEMVEDGGGWTLVLKIDGKSGTFMHDDPLWKNSATLNPSSPDLTDLHSAKLASYAAVSVTDLRLGMISPQAQTPKWIVAHPAGSGPSLLSLVSGGTTPTMVTAATWESLLQGSMLDSFSCETDGINAPGNSGDTSVRIGIVAGGPGSCLHADTAIGFGITGLSDDVPCGNFQLTDSNIRAFGFVMVR